MYHEFFLSPGPGPPPPPTITDISFSAGVSFTVRWSGNSRDKFNVDIFPNNLYCDKRRTSYTCQYNSENLGQSYVLNVTARSCDNQRESGTTITLNLGMSLYLILHQCMHVDEFGTNYNYRC